MITLNKDSKTIYLANHFSRNLAFRNTVRNLFHLINESDLDEVILNFQDVEIISRSFAHEILVSLRETEKKVLIENLPPNVQRMFDLVKSHKSYSS